MEGGSEMTDQGANYGSRQLVAVTVFPLLVVVAVVVYLLVINDRLPAEVATHWGADGTADGFTSRSALPWLVGGLMIAATIPMSLLALWVNRSATFVPRTVNGISAWMASFIGVLTVSSVVPQLDTTVAPDLSLFVIAPAFAIAFLAGFVGAAIAGSPPPAPKTTAAAPADAPRHSLQDGQTAVWSGRTSSGIAIQVTLALAVIVTVIVGAFSSWWVLFINAIVAMIIAAMSNFNVTAGPTGLRVSGVLGFPRITVPLNEITQATAGTVRALEFGGWGWRIRKGQTAVLTRSGPALTVTRTDGARLHVTIDDPEKPAAVISTLLDQRATA